MGHPALKESAVNLPTLTLIKGGAAEQNQVVVSNVMMLGITLSVMQLLDGTLTAIGVGLHGIENEGNPFVRMLMQTIGHIPAIFLVKIAAILVTLKLCSLAREVKWIPTAMKCVIAIYAVMAILPWSFLLLSEYLLG